MKKAILVAIIGAFAVSVNAGDWGGKDVVGPKVPIGCPDTSGYVDIGYDTDYLYKGYRFYTDSTHLGAGYTFESVVPVTLSVNHISATRIFDNAGVPTGGLMGSAGRIENSITEVGVSAQVASVAGVDVTLGYTHRFYSGVPVAGGGVSSNGELNLGLSKDLDFVRVHFDLYYNLNTPESWNVTAPGVKDDSESWFWDLGVDKTIGLTDNVSLALGAGVTYADNYWGGSLAGAPSFTPRASGWNSYYVRVGLPIELNCAATLTPYIAYSGAPDGFLMDGAPVGGSSGQPQSDIFYGGVSLNVKF